ncbi:MAG: hypothetical protein JXR52_07885 [Bacteroidales bacterium]|nr:hypothetical protein [Bacteroidales bacterium]
MKKLSLLQNGFTLFLLPLAILSSCSEEDPEQPQDKDSDGTFEISITGNETYSWTGEATFLYTIDRSDDSESNGTYLGITLSDDDENVVQIYMAKQETDGFSTGKYEYISEPDDDDIDLVVSVTSTSSGTIYYISSGHVTLSSFGSGVIEGVIDVNLSDFFTEKSVNVSGDFKASGLKIYL